ncbi:MAG: hypothetical protein ONB44_23850 [candidate division KSB1 bacterium]|nr:hypothetical protein [candidate division KSB1 bacterium]MDZ7305178.1 hypothetical protein [candidate division KSB1 bacterium]MDZ7314272.1 hypothetical protein [candidate division KSB1 bacterium]
MPRRFWINLSTFVFLQATSLAQMNLAGRMEVVWIDAQEGQPGEEPSENIVNHGEPTFLWRLRIYLDMPVSERSSIFSDLRLEPEGLQVDFAAIRLFLNAARTVSVQAGVLGTPIGNVTPRRSSKDNPLINLPAMYDYRTQLPGEAAFDYQALRSNRGTGKGLRLLNLGAYSPGAAILVSWWDRLDLNFGVFNYSPSNPYTAYSQLNLTQRLGCRPLMGLNVGFSLSKGAYRRPAPERPDPQQLLYDVDFSYERGHLSIFGEAVWNRWDSPVDDNRFKARGYYLETKYKFHPHFFVALRVASLQFNAIRFPDGIERAWEDDLRRYEWGLGYYFARETLGKLVYQKNVTERVDIRDDYVALQLSSGF